MGSAVDKKKKLWRGTFIYSSKLLVEIRFSWEKEVSTLLGKWFFKMYSVIFITYWQILIVYTYGV